MYYDIDAEVAVRPITALPLIDGSEPSVVRSAHPLAPPVPPPPPANTPSEPYVELLFTAPPFPPAPASCPPPPPLPDEISKPLPPSLPLEPPP